MNTPSLVALLSLVAPGVAGLPVEGDPAIEIAAYLDGDSLTVGGEASFLVRLELPAELKASGSGAPAPFLQLDVPPSVRLKGRYLESYTELTKNEFLMEPFERLLSEPLTVVPFELVSEPGEDETIGINVIAYLRPAGAERAYFLRRRFELPLRPGAEAREVPATVSSWGPDRSLLQIGMRAADVTLPDAGGGDVSLGDYLGESHLIVTTYRAHW